jgi:hypothetical protein
LVPVAAAGLDAMTVMASAGDRRCQQRGDGGGVVDRDDQSVELGPVEVDDDGGTVAVDGGEVPPPAARRVPSEMTPGIPVPGARMPRSSAHGWSVIRTAETLERGSRTSPWNAPSFSSQLRCSLTVSPSTVRLATSPVWTNGRAPPGVAEDRGVRYT